MTLGLHLTGILARRDDDPLASVISYLREAHGSRLGHVERAVDDDGRPCLAVSLHPAAEEIVVTDLGGTRLAATAKTSTAGPGYHAFVCDVLHALGAALPIAWDDESADGEVGDETGYFHSGDYAALEARFLEWTRGLAAQVRTILDQGGTALAVSMPATHEVFHDGAIATPLGPRDRAWLDRVAENPAAGVDLFPWWHRGEGPHERLGRALARMWTDVRWRPPTTDGEREVIEETVGLLEAAYREDPKAPYPWSEWSELLAFLGRDSLLATRAQLRAATAAPSVPIGYRRRDVRVMLSGGWSVVVPGAFAEAWDERGTWSGWDAKRTVWFTSFSLQRETGAPTAEETLAGLPPLEGEVLRASAGDAIYAATFARGADDEGALAQLQGYAAAPGSAAVCTVCFDEEARREWAIAVWKSLRWQRD